MQLKLNRYLFELRKNAIRFERIDINGNTDKSFFSKNFRRIICFVIALLAVCFLHNGFSSNFVSYTSTVLSILIGLFITAIIFSFDKFHQNSKINSKSYGISIKRKDTDNPEKEYEVSLIDISLPTSKENLWNTQSFNYSKQFAYITGYNIVLSVFTIAFLSFSTMFESRMSINVCDYYLNLHNINKETVFNFANITFALLQRFCVIYWTSSIMYNTLFLVSSMVNFMTIKIDRENDSN